MSKPNNRRPTPIIIIPRTEPSMSILAYFSEETFKLNGSVYRTSVSLFEEGKISMSLFNVNGKLLFNVVRDNPDWRYHTKKIFKSGDRNRMAILFDPWLDEALEIVVKMVFE